MVENVSILLEKRNGLLNWTELSELLKRIFSFLTVTSIYIGCSGFFKTFAGFILLGLTPIPQVCFAVFLITFGVYSLNKLTDMKEDAINMPERLSFLRGRTTIVLVYSLAAYLLSIVLTMMEKPAALPVVFIPLVANVLYSSRLVPGLPRLKDIPVMKNVVVALSWALVCTLLPAAHMGSLNSMVFLTIIFMSAKSFINTVLYDIRDLEGDRESGVRTIPVLLGPANAVAILLAVNSALLSLLLVTDGLCRMLMAGMILYSYAYILYFRERRSPVLLDLFVDGEWILACVLVWTLGWGFGLQA